MPNIGHDRWLTALQRVAMVEHKSKMLKTRFLPRKFEYAKRSAWATSAGYAALPKDQQHQETLPGSVRTRVRAESVLIGKFDVDAEVRLRAFYPKSGVSIRYQTGGKANGVTRTVNAYKRVRRYAPDLMPAVHEHGTILDGRGAFLVEDTVAGETATRAELEAMIVPLTRRLHAVHQGVGITDKRASAVLGRQYLERWTDFVELHKLDPVLDQKVQKLLERDALLEVSLTHGDLVNSNILVDGKDFVLVDWEWSMVKPIAFDLSKMIVNVSDLEQVLVDVQTGLGDIGSKKSHYTFREQVALALIQALTFYKRQLLRAQKAKRTEALARQTAKRVTALSHLLESAPAVQG